MQDGKQTFAWNESDSYTITQKVGIFESLQGDSEVFPWEYVFSIHHEIVSGKLLLSVAKVNRISKSYAIHNLGPKQYYDRVLYEIDGINAVSFYVSGTNDTILDYFYDEP